MTRCSVRTLPKHDGVYQFLGNAVGLRDIGFNGGYLPDHVPAMEGDSNKNAGYSPIARLFVISYLKGLQQAVYADS